MNVPKQLVVSGLQILFYLKVSVNCLINSLSAIVFLEEGIGWGLHGGEK